MFNYMAHDDVSSSFPGAKIHPSAMIAKGAELGQNVSVGPNAIVGPNVQLADDVVVGAGAIVSGRTKVGARTKIYPMATVGSDPQDLKYADEQTECIIGTDNLIREYVNISTGTVSGGGKTTIGDHNLIMVYSHVAHDCHIGNHCVFANGVQIAGHAVIGNHVVFGGMSGAHQFCRFGDRVMVAAGAIVVQDVPPFCMVHGDRARINGLNIVGLRRSGMKRDRISDIKAMFKYLYNENITMDEAIERILTQVPSSDEKDTFVSFLKESERGVCR